MDEIKFELRAELLRMIRDCDGIDDALNIIDLDEELEFVGSMMHDFE